MTYELAVGLRYLKSRRRQTFISLITVISVGGVAVGVMVLIVVLAVMSGFETSLKDKILGINSHIWILPQTPGRLEGYQDIVARVAALPHVTFAAPFTTHEVMLVAEGHVAGTIVRGIDPDRTDQMADLTRHMHGQELRTLLEPPPPPPGEAPTIPAASRGIVLGKELARHLLVFPGQQVMVTSPLGVLTPAGIMPNMRGFTVTGTFDTGMYEYDAKLALMSLRQAQDFFELGDAVHGIEVKVDDIYRVHAVEEAIQQLAWSGVLDAQLDADESQPVCRAASGKSAHVYHPRADYFGGGFQYCQHAHYVGHGKTGGYRHSESHGGSQYRHLQNFHARRHDYWRSWDGARSVLAVWYLPGICRR